MQRYYNAIAFYSILNYDDPIKRRRTISANNISSGKDYSLLCPHATLDSGLYVFVALDFVQLHKTYFAPIHLEVDM